jgi:hypothetical protein
VQELKNTQEAWCIEWKEDIDEKHRINKKTKCISERGTKRETDARKETLMQQEHSSAIEH